MKKMLLTLLIGASFTSYSQEEAEPNRVEGHFLSLQVNELVRQVLSLGNTNLPDNPYFFNYRYIGATGDGLNVGFALTLDNISNANEFSDISTDISNFSFRIGYDKQQYLGKNFVLGIGVDLTVDRQKNETVNVDLFNSQEITTTSTLSGWGLGPRVTFSYRISDRIWVGTEANYYFKSLTNKFEQVFSNSPGFDDNNSESDIERFTFAAPSILWLSLRL